MALFDWIKKEKTPPDDPTGSDVVRKRLRFHGRVQGVGFRYTASHYANDLRLTGWVHNEYDGTVLMEVQGSPEGIDQLLGLLQSGPYISIDRIESEDIAPDYHESRFGSRW